jgi:hypothetical protein
MRFCVKLLVDARYIGPAQTGVGVYASEMLKALRRVAPDAEIHTLVWRHTSVPAPNQVYAPDHEQHPRNEFFLAFGLMRSGGRPFTDRFDEAPCPPRSRSPM